MDSLKLLELVQKYDAPLYVYQADSIVEKYKEFTSAFSVPRLGVHYACKALPNISILKLLNHLNANLDCVSIQEVRLGIEAGFEPERILFTPNNISEEEYALAVKYGVGINIDNLEMLEYFGNYHKDVPICIRFNPHLMAGGNRKISVGHIGSKFGISIYQLPHVERIVKSYKLNVNGIHVHTGSDILDPDVFIRAAHIILEIADHFENLDFIDFGSGFKVPYKSNGLGTDIKKIGSEFSAVFNDYCKKRGQDLELKFEPGKYLVSEAGYFLTRVNVVKQTTSTTFAGIDAGFNNFIRPMFYDSYHEIRNLSNPQGDEKVYSVVGFICETDTFGVDRRLKEVRKNDILCFYNAGAYCHSMASNYNSRYRPAEVMVMNGQDYLIREREKFDDLIRNQVIIDDIIFQ